jgi:hypothetical protein
LADIRLFVADANGDTDQDEEHRQVDKASLVVLVA